jgi:hypothetical protein
MDQTDLCDFAATSFQTHRIAFGLCTSQRPLDGRFHLEIRIAFPIVDVGKSLTFHTVTP